MSYHEEHPWVLTPGLYLQQSLDEALLKRQNSECKEGDPLLLVLLLANSQKIQWLPLLQLVNNYLFFDHGSCLGAFQL